MITLLYFIVLCFNLFCMRFFGYLLFPALSFHCV